ncbi:hypothetical protein Hte_001903 [Hypoxylon texense]
MHFAITTLYGLLYGLPAQIKMDELQELLSPTCQALGLVTQAQPLPSGKYRGLHGSLLGRIEGLVACATMGIGAGISIDQVRGTQTAVFSGSFSDDYSRMLSKDPDNFPQTAVTGTAFSILANRISWYFNLIGPSVAVDTACSSSLVAVDLACQSIRDGTSSMRSTQLSSLGFLSPDGVCYSFDHRANGYSRGEGVISLVLKPVRDAVEAGDTIRAIIRSTGMNQDGKTPSLTQPNPKSQEALIRSVYEKAGLDFSPVRYFEAHEISGPIEDEVGVETLLQELDQLHPPFKIFTVIARNLESILCGDMDPLRLVFDTGLAAALYEDVFSSVSDDRFRELLQLIAHESPNFRILEVGAGTGSWTKRMLSILGEWERRTAAQSFSLYTYTDISGAFFERAQREFPDPRLSFRVFDLERPAADQGLDLASYDLIIAGSVLHATSNLACTMQNLHTLAKPGARLINIEIVAPEKLSTNFAFGLFPGWWLSTEPWRSQCPVVDEARWDGILKENGFSGNDIVLRDYQSETGHIFSLMVSTVTASVVASGADPEIPFFISEAILVVDSKSDQQVVLAENMISKLLVPLGYAAQLVYFDSLDPSLIADAEIVVSLVELNQPFLARMSDPEFESLKILTAGLRRLLWITSSALGDDASPHYSLVQGYLRSLRSVAVDKHIITLAIETEETNTNIDFLFTHIEKVFQASFGRQSPEIEYIYSKDENYDLDLKPAEVEIETKAWGLAFRDVFVALGRLDGADLGVDCAGVVSRVGPGQLLFQPGDRVAGCAPGCMRTFARASSKTIHKISDSLSFEAAVSVVNPGTTAYHCLINIARLRRGETILIHSAAGSTGQVAVQIATMLGAIVFATVGSESKKKLLIDNFGIQDNNIFYSRNDGFAKGVMRRTNDRGVDVVLNSLAGDSLLASWKCVAPFGRFIEIGKADIIANSSLPMASFARNISFCAVDLHHMIETEPELFSTILANTMALIEKGDISPPEPLHIYALSNVEDAFRYLQSGKNTGRIILNVESVELVEEVWGY